MRLVDANGSNVLDDSSTTPWMVIIPAAAGGGELMMAQADICTENPDGTISVSYRDFLSDIVGAYLLVPENEDDKFFQYLPALATLAGAWSELRKGIETWTSTTPGAFAKRLDGAFAKADKSKFEWTSDFIETGGTDEPPGLARGSDWPDSLRWVPTLASSTAFGKIGVDEGAERPSRAAADLYRYVGPLVNPEDELAKGKPAQRAVALLTALSSRATGT